MKHLYITGHKNPDCDSVVSAIGYAYYKEQHHQPAIPIVLGQITSEVRYLLNRFGFKTPILMQSAKCTLSEIEMDQPTLVSPNITLYHALEMMFHSKNKGLFVVDDNECLIGLISLSDLTKLWAKSLQELGTLLTNTPLDNIVEVIAGKIYHQPKSYSTNGIVKAMPSLLDDPSEYKDSIVIVRNGPDTQRFAIEAGAKMLIVSGEDWLDNVTLQKAIEQDVAVIQTEFSVIECSKRLFQAPPIADVMTKQIIRFYDFQTTDEVSKEITKTRFRTYPVLNKQGKIMGAISRYHLFHYEKKKFVLVDHNEVGQSIDDLEFGEVVEIIDHHRFGGIETDAPINIMAKSVGSTAGIIAGLFRQEQLDLPKELAGLLLAACLHDTMCLRSPTTTMYDRDIVEYLEDVCQLDREQLYQEMIDACESVMNKTNQEILYGDFKEFKVDDGRIAISQTPCRKQDFHQIIKSFDIFAKTVMENQKYDLLVVLFTDPNGSGSYLYHIGKKMYSLEKLFMDQKEKDGFCRGIVSRKKQVVPAIINAIQK